MLTVVAPTEQLTPDQELELSKRLAQWRPQPLSPEELAALLPKVSDPALLRDTRKALPAGTALWAMVETCAGCIALDAIAANAKEVGLTALVMGTNDLALEMRCGSDAAPCPAVEASLARPSRARILSMTRSLKRD